MKEYATPNMIIISVSAEDVMSASPAGTVGIGDKAVYSNLDFSSSEIDF